MNKAPRFRDMPLGYFFVSAMLWHPVRTSKHTAPMSFPISFISSFPKVNRHPWRESVLDGHIIGGKRDLIDWQECANGLAETSKAPEGSY